MNDWQTLLRSIDRAGRDIPLDDWIRILDNLIPELEARRDAARDDLRNQSLGNER